jgi:hypothetical protein
VRVCSERKVLLAGFDDWFVLREKYCWLVADKASEQGDDKCFKLKYLVNKHSSMLCKDMFTIIASKNLARRGQVMTFILLLQKGQKLLFSLLSCMNEPLFFFPFFMDASA